MKQQKQLVNFVKQVAVIECEGYKKHGEGNVLLTEFSKHIAHGFGHEGKCSGSIYLTFFRDSVQIRTSVVTAKVKVFRPAPFNNNLEGFNIIHGRLNFFSFRETGMITGRDGVRSLIPHCTLVEFTKCPAVY